MNTGSGVLYIIEMLDVISFIFEELLYMDAVVTSIGRQTAAGNFRLGCIATVKSID